ncbi:glycerophosphodiester phosphodiesterase [Burkholderia gladioli]|jgi:glycerophosphoryl diester phosphodiesterase|uniref:Glycerophosphoryl diester phosphodiesterase n=1 Tax=Burkholderia gladioli TaxID=28095 RepID=A0AAW3F977_BURGA|nr:glycerophosphodiester phosphodiesterase [Burkholderia gladioli]AJW98294.1 glycerophosphoryl diester phosphodiesterase [Burkholderia gladioli]ASD77859.1 glycerophosphoryl diester phosphodiesterase [Burkholderia gladioli pv. gladioli]AWY53229.1 glycerophosphoryl diester phosphodiesterase [Burkholderia gladioli pv. gladioli]KGC17559.1 glycerophosphoryl diester phosphodiesterase [Burkholderia gladioli]KKJ03319.1 glycerophosphodiester phosphodiesterase [Burkholderia gladioli]
MTDPKSWPYEGIARIVAHRGGGKLAPENTLAALEEGARRGHRMVEFDAKLSADAVSFLLHDDGVERTSNGRGPAAAMRYQELAALDAGAWFDARFAGERMPTLEAAAARCLALGLAANVEIKPCPGREVETGERVALDTARYWRGAAVPPLLSSFSVDALDAARRAVPDLPRGLLVETLPDDWRALTAELGCVALHANHREFDAARVAEIRAAGLRMLAYTVNEPARARELMDWGVDLICTDRIDLIGPDFA